MSGGGESKDTPNLPVHRWYLVLTKSTNNRLPSVLPTTYTFCGIRERRLYSLMQDTLDAASPSPEPLVEADGVAVVASRVDPDGVRVKSDGGLVLHSRRTQRLRKKQLKKQNKPLPQPRGILDLPYELLMEILSLVYPSDLVRLSRANRSLKDFIDQEERTLARQIITRRYSCLEKCFRLPILLEEVDVCFRPVLQSPERHGVFLKRTYAHVKAPDPNILCTCLTCVLRWSSLCLIVDFAHFQGHLDRGDPMPIIKPGRNPAWNQEFVNANSQVVMRAVREPLWHACILEAHLKSIVRSIKRHSANKGNRRSRFRMTKEDEQAGNDLFLERSGPPTVDFPFNRDNYYMLETYLPNRGWNGDEGRWMYMDASQHDIDVAMVVRWEQRQREEASTRRT